MSTRRQVRDAFAELARGHVTDAQRVYPLTNDDGERVTQPFDFSGESPVVVVASSGTERGQKTFRGAMPTYYLDVHVFVRATGRGPHHHHRAFAAEVEWLRHTLAVYGERIHPLRHCDVTAHQLCKGIAYLSAGTHGSAPSSSFSTSPMMRGVSC
jgi:hypothetical protein